MNITTQDDITAYVEGVRAALAGLPDATRDELLEDLPEHLAEVTADGAGSLADRLGTPEAYAAELRATAAFVDGLPDPPAATDRVAELRDDVLRWLRTADVRVGPLVGYPRASDFLILLRPAWWVLRGYLAAMVLAWALDDSGQPMGLLPRIGGSEVVAVLLLAGGILGSLWLGRRSAGGLAPWPRYALYTGSTVLVLVAIGGFLGADGAARDSGYADVNYNDPYTNVRDVFVYDEHGRLVTNARLFDQDGQPIHLGSPSCFDENSGSDTAVEEGRYPYCARNAPFTLSSAAPSAAEASATPGLSAGPTPVAGVLPSAGGSAGPSATSRSRPEPTPTPTE